ncbi:MAG: hypothetical protein LW825_01365, partial [Candidatus Jidaibacter sp.]|jgi:uncharacterized protein YjbI with pentapeptide repeats|nr:hypothetical protein [Candidatus Jidaibacter sp.]
LGYLPNVVETYFNSQEVTEEQKGVNDGYLAILRNADAVAGVLATLRSISTNEAVNDSILKYLMAKDYATLINEKTTGTAFRYAKQDYEEKHPGEKFTRKMHLAKVLKDNPQDLASKELINVVQSIINLPLESLTPLLSQLEFITRNLQLNLPEGLVTAIVSDNKATVELLKIVVGMFDGINAVYKAMGGDWSKNLEAMMKKAVPLVEVGAVGNLMGALLAHERVINFLPKLAENYLNNLEATEEQKVVNDGYLAILRNADAVKGVLETLKVILTTKGINSNIAKLLIAKNDPEDKGLASKELINVVQSIINLPLESLTPLLSQLDFITKNLQLNLPEGLVATITSNNEAMIKLAKVAVGMFDGINAVYKAMGNSWSENLSAMLTAAESLVKSGDVGTLIEKLLAHEGLTKFVVKYVGDYITAMDMSLPGSDLSKHTNNIIRFLQNANLWDHIIANETLRDKLIVPLAKSYLQRVEDMSFEERKAGYDRLHEKDEVIAPDYTQEMFEADKQAAKVAKDSYIAILSNGEVMRVLTGVGKLVLDKNNQDIITYRGKDGKLGDILSVVQTLIDDDKLYPLVGELEFIFNALAPNNFTKDAPEFADNTYVDKALLGLISAIFDPAKKEQTTKFLTAALGKVEVMLAEFKTKSLFDAAASVIHNLSGDEVLKGFVESNPDTIGRIVRYVATKMFDKSLKQYGVEDKFWGLLDILFTDLNATYDILTGLAAISNSDNYKDSDSTIKAIDKLVRELVKLVEHPVIGRKVQSFIKENRNVFVSLINGVVDSLGVRQYVTDYLHGYGLEFADILDQITDRPRDLIAMLDAAAMAKQGISNASVGGVISGAATAVMNPVATGFAAAKAVKDVKNVLYAPTMQKVIAELATPYVPTVVSSNTPDWLKYYIPGAGTDPRGAGFADWAQDTINAKHEAKVDLHDHLMKNVDGGPGYEAMQNNMLNGLTFSNTQLLLRNYKIDDFNFSLSKAVRVFVTDSNIRNTMFDGFEAKQFSGSKSNLYNVSFAGAKIQKIVFDKDSVLAKVGFQGAKVGSFNIEGAHLSEVDFAGLTFEHEIIRVVEKEVKGWLWGSTVKTEEIKVVEKNEDAILTIKDTEMDEVTLNNLIKAARSGEFKIDLQNVKVVSSKGFEVDTVENQLVWCTIKAATKNGAVTIDFSVGNQMDFSNPDYPVEIQKWLMSQRNIKMFLEDRPEKFAEILKGACDAGSRKSDVEGIVKDIQEAVNGFMKEKSHEESVVDKRGIRDGGMNI